MRRCTVHCKERENGDGAARYSSFTPLWNMLEVNAIALSCHLNLFACYVLQRIWKYIIKKVGTPSQCEHSGLGVKSKVQSGFGETINYTYCIINTAEFFYIKANAFTFSHSRLSRYISLFLKTVYKQLRRDCAVLQI